MDGEMDRPMDGVVGGPEKLCVPCLFHFSFFFPLINFLNIFPSPPVVLIPLKRRSWPNMGQEVMAASHSGALLFLCNIILLDIWVASRPQFHSTGLFTGSL